MKLPISVCMIVKDEAEFLKRSLEGCTSFASEIIVVDTGSRDSSKDIALHAGARVVDYTWNNDFSAARNFSLNLSREPWTLVLDGDEILGSEAPSALRECIKEDRCKAFYLHRRHYVPDLRTDFIHRIEEPLPIEAINAKGYQLTEDVRFFKSGLFNYQGRVHELIEGSIWNQGYEIGRCSAIIHHFAAFKESGEDRKRKLYLELARAEYKDSPDNWKSLLQLVSELKQSGLPEEAFALLESRGHAFQTNAAILKVWGWSCIDFGDLTRAAELLKRAVEMEPKDFSSWNGLGLSLLRLGQPEAAIQCYSVCRSIAPHDPGVLINMGLATLINGNNAEALALFDEAHTLFPDFEAARVCAAFLHSLNSGTTPSAEDSLLFSQLVGAEVAQLFNDRYSNKTN